MEDMNTMIAHSSLPARCCAWLQYLRTPGVSLQYTMEKRHIPDMNAAVGTTAGTDNGKSTGGGKTADTAAGTGRTEPTAGEDDDGDLEPTDTGCACGADCTCGTGTAGASTDTTDIMRLTGTLRARYFDLAVGMLGIAAACCLIKGCLCGCRCLRKYM